MYVRQPNLFKSRSSHIVSMKFHRVHTYIFLDPFLFACDSLYNPKTQLFRSCYFVLVTKYQTLGGMDSSFEHPKPALFYILAHLPLIIGNVCSGAGTGGAGEATGPPNIWQIS